MKQRINMIDKFDLTHIGGEIEIRPIADVHVGAQGFNQKKFEQLWAIYQFEDNRGYFKQLAVYCSLNIV